MEACFPHFNSWICYFIVWGGSGFMCVLVLRDCGTPSRSDILCESDSLNASSNDSTSLCCSHSVGQPNTLLEMFVVLFFILDLMPHNHDPKRTGDLLRDSQRQRQLSSKYKSSPSTYFTGLNKLWVILMNKIYLLEWASSSGHSFCSSTWATEKGSHQGAQVMAAIMISQEPNRNACVFVLTMVITATYLNRKELEAEREARGDELCLADSL